MLEAVYRFLYLIIYSVFLFHEIVCEKWSDLRKYLSDLNQNITGPAMEQFVFQGLDKTPNHISFIIDETPSYKDLANLVIWCMITRISFVSFYDKKGFLKKGVEKLEYEVNERKLPSDHVFWHNQDMDDFKNGFSGRKVHVKILTEKESKKSLEILCKKLIAEETSTSEITTEFIDDSLRELYGFPDPDVGVIFSKIFSLSDYPPWQIRLTELYRLNSHYNITFNDFVNVLTKYSKCDQRWGT
ncbi:hypothetical protein WA026_005822 [Henosepilachna vigintioctopunctata]|uniref:ditrans,polycis-polyprenyl diphosphate synthase [(2E,6E)-farnesyldiphosphate specific] n=1 Tax=Henosepilachna vigintioctopunctata TaxID=420089 RepID=A0AAW1U424_9CUCU